MEKLLQKLIFKSNFFSRFYLLFGVIFSITSYGFANDDNATEAPILDEIKVTGKVVDELGDPMVGVTIIVNGTTKGTITDIDGNFNISVEAGATLLIRFIGYKPQEITIADRSQATLNISLEPDISQLDEVVVVGFGEQTKQTLIGAVSVVRGEELLEAGSVSTVSEALTGALPGLTAVMSSGRPGDDAAELFIRGRSSWSGQSQQPFTLVDGVERNINNLDPNEIESISVLKDASATAIYGVRGANGVILITTKRGKTGKPQFNLSTNFGVKEATARQTYADYITAMKMYNEAAINDKNWGQIIPESTINAWTQNYDQRGPYNQYFPEVNWFDELLGTGYEQTYNLNARGGTDFVKYFVSLGYRNDGDIFQTESHDDYEPKFGLERYNWRTNLDFDLTPSTRFSVNFSGNYKERHQPAYRADDWGDNKFFNRLFVAPNNRFPLQYPDGTYGDSPAGEHNMVMNINEGGQRTYYYYQGFYDAQLDQKLDFITKGLRFKAGINYTSYSNYESLISRKGAGGGGLATIDVIRYSRDYDYANPFETADGGIGYPVVTEMRFPDDDAQAGPISSTLPDMSGYGRKLNYRFQADYKRKFGDHTLSGTAVMWRQIDTGRGGYPEKREEWVGRINYYFKNKYLLEVNSTYSGSEKFSEGLRFGLFPSIGAGWVVSEEGFMKSIAGSWLNFLKFNYSYGVVGSDGGPRFQYAQVYERLNSNVNFGYENWTPYGPRYVEGTPANPNSTWETSKMQNLSVKMDLINKINVSVDFFNEERSNILMQKRTQPAWYGTEKVATGNIGATKNRGYEIEIGWSDNIGPDFNYYLNFNTAYSENRVTFRDDPRLLDGYLKEAGKPIGWVSRLVANGYYGSLDDIYNAALPSHGSSQDALVPGDVMFVDFNGDATTDSRDQVPMKNVQYPWRTFGLNFGFTYKNIGFNALMYGVTDVGYNFPNLLYWDFNNGFINAQSNVTSRWTRETALIAGRPALHLTNNHNSTNSTLQYQDGSYLRLKNVEINYKFTPGALKAIGLKRFQVYINGNNLITWQKIDKRIDPETNGSSTYPIVKRYNVGLRASF